MPVMLPPGWARTRDSTGANRIASAEENNGILFRRLFLRAQMAGVPCGEDRVHFQTD